MGTRGIFGVVIDGEVKSTYNHSDSYPDGLGVDIVEQIQNMISQIGLKAIKSQAKKMKLVSNEKARPTEKEISLFHEFSDSGTYGDGSGLHDWYNLLRNLQGNLTDTLAVGFMNEGGNEFAEDSLFCEWGYLVNLDENILEVYRGFQTKPHQRGRFSKSLQITSKEIGTDVAVDGGGKPIPREYYPIALITTFPFDQIPNNFNQICEFCGLDLFITEDGKEWEDANEVVSILSKGQTCIGFSVFSKSKDPITKLIFNGIGDFTFESIEED